MSTDTVEWGADERPDRRRLDAIAARLRVRERHLRLGIAAAGAGFVALSLLIDWQVTTPQDIGGTTKAHTAITGLGALGAGYLVGVMALAALSATILFGPAAVRPHLRIAGLGWAGGLLGVLLAAVAALRATSAVFGAQFTGPDGPEYSVSYGSGVFLAIGGVGLVALAIYLTDQTRAEPVPVEEPAEKPTSPAMTAGPADLTVAPVKPFVHLPEQR